MVKITYRKIDSIIETQLKPLIRQSSIDVGSGKIINYAIIHQFKKQ